MFLWTLTLTKALKEQSNQALRFLTPILEKSFLDFFFFTIQAVNVFALRVFLFAGVRRTKRCEPVPSRWLDGEQWGQCYSHRSLRQDSPTRWIISGLCRYCRGVGKEWQHYTLLERDGEQLAVLEDSHICIKYRPASYYWANIYCKAKGALQTTKKYASFLTYRGKNWLKLTVERKRGRGGYVYCGGREWKECVDETRSQMFSMKTLIWDALPEVRRRSGEKQAEWICNRNAFQLFTWGPSKALLGQMLKFLHFLLLRRLKESLQWTPPRSKPWNEKWWKKSSTRYRGGWGGFQLPKLKKKEKKEKKPPAPPPFKTRTVQLKTLNLLLKSVLKTLAALEICISWSEYR